MANLISIKLSKSASERWGFRLGGGKDFATHLSIQKVAGGSVAEMAGLRAGDMLAKVDDVATAALSHKEAQDLVIKAGNNLTLTVHRGGKILPPRSADNQGSVQVRSNPASKPSSRPVSMVSEDLLPIAPHQENFNEDAIAETLSSQSEVLNTGSIGVNFLKFGKKHYDPQQSAVYKMVHSIDEEPDPKVVTLPEKDLEERGIRHLTNEPIQPAPPKQTPVQVGTQLPVTSRPAAGMLPSSGEFKPQNAGVKSTLAPQFSHAERQVPAPVPVLAPALAPAPEPAPKQKRVYSNVKPSAVIWPPPPPPDSDEEDVPSAAALELATLHANVSQQVESEEPKFPVRTNTKPAMPPVVSPQAPAPVNQPNVRNQLATPPVNCVSQPVVSPAETQTLLSGPPIPELYPLSGPAMPAVRPRPAAQPVEVPKPKQYKIPMTPSATLSKPVGPSQPSQNITVIPSFITPMSSLSRLATPSLPKQSTAQEPSAIKPYAPDKRKVAGTNKVLNIRSFNSPVGLYSEATLREAVSSDKQDEAELIGPFSFGKWEKDYGFLRNSDVYRLVHEMETNPASKEEAGAH